MNPLKLRDQWGYSETSKNGWIRLRASETKTAQKISSRNIRWNQVSFFGLRERQRKKQESVGKIKIILFDSEGLYF